MLEEIRIFFIKILAGKMSVVINVKLVNVLGKVGGNNTVLIKNIFLSGNFSKGLNIPDSTDCMTLRPNKGR